MRNTRLVILSLAAIAAALAAGASRTRALMADDDKGKKIILRDDCDPDDSEWTPLGGCELKDGDVDFAEFFGELISPLSAAVIGHQAWRNDPPYLKIKADDEVRVSNRGGRAHTFTEVANFGGGRIPVPPLNHGMVMAPECATSTDIAPGERVRIQGLAPGNHRFQCCIHPWMRAVVKVED